MLDLKEVREGAVRTSEGCPQAEGTACGKALR